MKASILVLLLAAASACSAHQILLYTGETKKSYNFFPLSSDYMEFSVKAKHDIYIALTPSPAFDEMYYEIVIGAWGNSKDEIRKDAEKNHVVERFSRTVDQNQFATYWVKLNKDEGTIEVGKNKDTQAIMRFVDPEYVDMKYFGVSTGYGSPGVWIINTNLRGCTEEY